MIEFLRFYLFNFSWCWPLTICYGTTVDPNAIGNANGLGRHNDDDDNDANVGEIVIEQQPLRRPSESMSDFDRNTIKKLQKKTKIEQQVANILCCSKEPLRDDQVDLCPRVWWDVCWTYDSQIEPTTEKQAQMRPVRDICWRLLFLSCCLPCCYPCYLTRTLRHRRRRVFRRQHMVPPELDTGIEKPLDDEINRTIHRTISTTKSRFCYPPPPVPCDNNNTDDNSDTKQQQQQQQQSVIQVNVIILQSATSVALERHLYGDEDVKETDENDGPAAAAATKSSPVVSRHPKVSTQPNLNAVKETVEDDDAKVIRPKQSVSIQTPPRHSNVLRRWSQLGSFGSSVARMSRRLKRTKEQREDGGNDDQCRDASNKEDGCDENVTLRKDQM